MAAPVKGGGLELEDLTVVAFLVVVDGMNFEVETIEVSGGGGSEEGWREKDGAEETVSATLLKEVSGGREIGLLVGKGASLVDEGASLLGSGVELLGSGGVLEGCGISVLEGIGIILELGIGSSVLVGDGVTMGSAKNAVAVPPGCDCVVTSVTLPNDVVSLG